jgi:hypothetical protein
VSIHLVFSLVCASLTPAASQKGLFVTAVHSIRNPLVQVAVDMRIFGGQNRGIPGHLLLHRTDVYSPNLATVKQPQSCQQLVVSRAANEFCPYQSAKLIPPGPELEAVNSVDLPS